MHRIEGENVDQATGVNLFKTNPPYTTMSAEFATAVQEEIAHVIEQAGYSLLFQNNDNHEQLYTAIRAIIYAGVNIPTGAILLWTTVNIPDGYFECDASAYSRSIYSDLFAVIGVDYGAGDGLTTFNVPDFRGLIPRGHGSQIVNGRTKNSGANVGDIQEDSFQGHWHKGWGRGFNFGLGTSYSALAATGIGLTQYSNVIDDAVTDGVNGTPRTDDETRMSNMAIKFIIKY